MKILGFIILALVLLGGACIAGSRADRPLNDFESHGGE